MSISNRFTNVDLSHFLTRLKRRKDTMSARAGVTDGEQAYLASAVDHQDLERRLKVLECQHRSVLHTLRVMKTWPR